MGQALLCARGGVTATGNEINLFGHNTTASAEGPTQVSCTEGETFSFAGASAGEDTINSDVLSAGDLFNIAYTDTGSNSTIAWVKANIQFASGQGNFHGD